MYSTTPVYRRRAITTSAHLSKGTRNFRNVVPLRACGTTCEYLLNVCKYIPEDCMRVYVWSSTEPGAQTPPSEPDGLAESCMSTRNTPTLWATSGDKRIYSIPFCHCKFPLRATSPLHWPRNENDFMSRSHLPFSRARSLLLLLSLSLSETTPAANTWARSFDCISPSRLPRSFPFPRIHFNYYFSRSSSRARSFSFGHLHLSTISSNTAAVAAASVVTGVGQPCRSTNGFPWKV